MQKTVLAVAIIFLLATAVAGAVTLDKNIEYVPNRIVVNFQPSIGALSIDYTNGLATTGVQEIDQLNTKYSAYDMYRLFPGSIDEDLKYFYVIRFDQDPHLIKCLSEYENISVAEHVEPIGIHKVLVTPNDPSYSSQWHLPKVSAPAAWDIEQGSQYVILGIPDTGVDWDHPDLEDNIWINILEDRNGNGQFDNYSYGSGGDLDNVDNDGNGYVDDVVGWDFVNNPSGSCTDSDCDNEDNDPMDYMGHGSHCSGIAAAVTNNSTGVAGMNWESAIMCLRVGYGNWWGGQVEMDFCAAAFNYAANKGTRILSCSWGNSNTGGFGTAVTNAINNGATVFVAAGNDNDEYASYLCSRSDVVAVAATDQNDYKASFSSYGTWVDCSAPGVDIYSTMYNNTYTDMDGTSMACPLTAGLGALITAQNMSITPEQVRQKIYDTCDDIDGINPSYAGKLGYGRINAYEALLGGGTVDPDIELTFTPENHPITINPPATFYYDISLDNNTDTTIYLDCWTMLTLPNNNPYGPLNLYYNVSFGPNSTYFVNNAAQFVPGYAMTGYYLFWGKVGDYPSNCVDSSYFNFRVISLALGGESGDWYSSG
ncbi:MAG: S8 family serine peptidase, partial [candidate division Zixibacteria bacterium]|nr:S8 family serine peptidase [candidate division Zixibacteria bacterium]